MRNVAAHREEIQLHEVALQFPQGDEARGVEPPAAALGDRGRRELALATRTNQAKGADTLSLPESAIFLSYLPEIPLHESHSIHCHIYSSTSY